MVNSSGGKDSQTALRVVVEECDRQGVDRSRIVVSHQCLGRVEWEGARDLVERQAAHYGLRVEISKYRDKYGTEGTLLDYVRKRRKWPDSQNRFCTSEFKRGPGGRVIVKLFREAAGAVLNVYGFRAAESPARAKRKVFARNARLSTGQREVWDWLPIHGWNVSEVWASIRESGVLSAEAYKLGVSRFSCPFCIFASWEDLLIAGRANRRLLDEFCDLEDETGHVFRHGLSINSVRDEIRKEEQSACMEKNRPTKGLGAAVAQSQARDRDTGRRQAFSDEG